MEESLCDWCFDDRKVMPKTGLCARCNSLRLKAEKAKQQLNAINDAGGDPNPYGSTLAPRMALKRVEAAKLEGRLFGPEGLSDFKDAIRLENALRAIAMAAVNAPVYAGHAGLIQNSFTPEEQLRILRLLAPLGRQVFRRRTNEWCMKQLWMEDDEATAASVRRQDPDGQT